MSSGSCNHIVQVADLKYSCVCEAGRFDYDVGTEQLSATCTMCTHPITSHSSVSTLAKADCVDVPDPLVSLRSDTVCALWKQLQGVRVIHVRGTPTSGKSTIAKLLHEHILLNSSYPAYLFSWKEDYFTMNRPYNDILNIKVTKRERDWRDYECVLLIDEAQLSYNCDTLWNDFIKFQASGRITGPYIILFSSYGSPSPTPAVGPPGSAPVQLRASQRVSVRPLAENNQSVFLYFTRAEYDDVLQRPFLLAKDLRDYIWELSAGHPGAVRAIIKSLLEAREIRPFRKQGLYINLANAADYLHSQDFYKCLLTGSEAYKRSLPRKNDLQNSPRLIKFIQKVLATGQSEDLLEECEDLAGCYKKGWLQAELTSEGKTVYVFPTLLHQR
ncbi:MAG: hypothetical protein M1829_001650 [Trizodia sp. TS-e1964]|nr:MAG: hypothetical protein M1829_001650 [Trizodia sp. TS-e1964]